MVRWLMELTRMATSRNKNIRRQGVVIEFRGNIKSGQNCDNETRRLLVIKRIRYLKNIEF